MAVVPDSLEKSEITFFFDDPIAAKGRGTDRSNPSGGDYVTLLPYVRVRTFDSALGNETDEYYMPLKVFMPLSPFYAGLGKTCIEVRSVGAFPINTASVFKGSQELHEYRDI